MERKRIREYGVRIGTLPVGAGNTITDVPGVKVGHATIANETNQTGVTVIIPREENVFYSKCIASAYVLNGYGKSLGIVQIDELGTLESPIALTNTLNVGLVQDALNEYTIRRCMKEKIEVSSLNSVVGETNDCFLNQTIHRAINQAHVFSAIENAGYDFAEGDVGAGRGTGCFGFKGGIGSASRILRIGGGDYTLGVLVQSNFGATEDLIVAGQTLGNKAADYLKGQAASVDQGSVMVIMATDLPLSSRQIRRVLKRGAIGLARTGSHMGNGSGDLLIGFSTANGQLPPEKSGEILQVSVLHEAALEQPFRAMIECTEEAVLNSMTMANTVDNGRGSIRYALGDFLTHISFEDNTD